jgi:hypothetical protein
VLVARIGRRPRRAREASNLPETAYREQRYHDARKDHQESGRNAAVRPTRSTTCPWLGDATAFHRGARQSCCRGSPPGHPRSQTHTFERLRSAPDASLWREVRARGAPRCYSASRRSARVSSSERRAEAAILDGFIRNVFILRNQDVADTISLREGDLEVLATATGRRVHQFLDAIGAALAAERGPAHLA